jgi:phytoene dehydrogenase-like protein
MYQTETGGLPSWSDGAILARALQANFGAAHIIIHFADLLEALVSAATTRGVAIQLRGEVIAVDLSQQTAVRLSNREYIKGDLILGANIERSVRQSILLGRSDLP